MTLSDFIIEQLQDPVFKKEWEEYDKDYKLAEPKTYKNKIY